MRKSKKFVVSKTGRKRGRPKGSVNKNKKRTMADYGPDSLKTLKCSKCHTETLAGSEAISVLCASCTQKSLPKADWGYHKPKFNGPKRKRGRPRKTVVAKADPNAPKRKRGRPRKDPNAPVVPKPHAGFGKGFALKKHFVAPNGDVYSFGKLVKKG